MIDAPGFDQRVKSEPYAERDYLGAARRPVSHMANE